MNELSQTTRQLPDTLEDLSKFVLIGREKLNAVRAEIRAIKAVELAAEVHEQKLQEAQEIAEAVLDAETKLGELTSQMEKSVNQHSANRNGAKSKKEQLAEIGINKDQASRFENLAAHPDIVEQAKAEARAEGRIVTRSDVLTRITPPKTAQQSMREFKQQAREEHKEFEQASKEDVVDIQDVKRDKTNLEIIALDINMTISRALASVATIGMIKEKEFAIMVNHLKPQAKRNMINGAQDGIRTLTHLVKMLEEGGRR